MRILPIACKAGALWAALLAPSALAADGLLALPTTPASVVPANLTLTEVVDRALRDNPQLTALRSTWDALRERPAQAGALPNPMVTVGGMDAASGGSWPDTAEKRYMVQQEFPWLGKRGLRADIAAKDAEIMRRELDALTREVVMQVKENYFQWYALQKVIATTRADQELLQRIEKIAETMYATGVRTQQDVLKAQSEITLLKQHLLDLEAQETTLQAKLNTLIDRRADAPLGTAVTPPDIECTTSVEDLFARAATNRPEVLAAQAQVKRYELEGKLMAKESLPDYRLGLEYRDLGQSEDMVMLTFSMDLPVWQSKNRAGVREADRMREASEAARANAERQSSLDVQDAAFRMQTARLSLDLYRKELIPQAEARFQASDADYRTGKSDFMDLLESQRFLLSVRVMAAQAEGDLGMEFARLERAVGSDLNTNQNSREMRP